MFLKNRSYSKYSPFAGDTFLKIPVKVKPHCDKLSPYGKYEVGGTKNTGTTPCSQTFLIHILPSERDITFHAHIKIDENGCSPACKNYFHSYINLT
jgi:hypothetical protein